MMPLAGTPMSDHACGIGGNHEGGSHAETEERMIGEIPMEVARQLQLQARPREVVGLSMDVVAAIDVLRVEEVAHSGRKSDVEAAPGGRLRLLRARGGAKDHSEEKAAKEYSKKASQGGPGWS